MLKTTFRFALLLFTLTCTTAHAVELAGLYEAEISVTGQDTAQRQDAMRAAFTEVLVKISGNRSIASAPGIAALVANAPQYVQQYVYRAAPPPLTAAPPGAARPTPTIGKILWVRFDSEVVNRMLRQNGVGIWGRARPSLLLWLELREQNERGIVGVSNKPEWKLFVDTVARTRGVPLLLPVLDTDDLIKLQRMDLWSASPEEVLRVSRRYQPEAVLLGRVEIVDGRWQSTWSLYDQENRQSWNTTGESRDATVFEGLHTAFDELAALYNTAGASESGSLLLVHDVQTLDEYARVTKYLGALASVAHLQLVRVEGPNLVFRMEAQGGLTRLANDIRLGTTLAVLPTEAPVEGAAAVRFRLVR